jgi:hypothetical protein
MTTYIALFSLTDAGIKAAKDSPRRLDSERPSAPRARAKATKSIGESSQPNEGLPSSICSNSLAPYALRRLAAFRVCGLSSCVAILGFSLCDLRSRNTASGLGRSRRIASWKRHLQLLGKLPVLFLLGLSSFAG